MELHLSGACCKDNTNSIHSSWVFLVHFDMLWFSSSSILKHGNTSNLYQQYVRIKALCWPKEFNLRCILHTIYYLLQHSFSPVPTFRAKKPLWTTWEGVTHRPNPSYYCLTVTEWKYIHLLHNTQSREHPINPESCWNCITDDACRTLSKK